MPVANAAERPSTPNRADDGPDAPTTPQQRLATWSGGTDHPLGNVLVLAALVTSPLMWVIELIAPQWVIYVFRASWVVLVAVAAVVVVRERRDLRRRSSGVRSDPPPSPER